MNSKMSVDEAKQIVCDAGRRLLNSELVAGTWGNISVRIDDTQFAITPSGMDYNKLTKDDIPIVQLSDLSYVGPKPSTEVKLHGEIYRTRKDANAIIHTHSMNASTVAAARREVPPILDDMAQIIGSSIRVAEYALPGTSKLVKGTVKALKGRSGVLLANHGALVIGRNIDEAFTAATILEKSCKAFIEAEFLGGAKSINKFEAALMHQFYLKKYAKK